MVKKNNNNCLKYKNKTEQKSSTFSIFGFKQVADSDVLIHL